MGIGLVVFVWTRGHAFNERPVPYFLVATVEAQRRPPSLPALPATHAPIALPALTSLPSPSIPGPGSPPTPPSRAPRDPPATPHHPPTSSRRPRPGPSAMINPSATQPSSSSRRPRPGPSSTQHSQRTSAAPTSPPSRAHYRSELPPLPPAPLPFVIISYTLKTPYPTSIPLPPCSPASCDSSPPWRPLHSSPGPRICGRSYSLYLWECADRRHHGHPFGDMVDTLGSHEGMGRCRSRIDR